MKQIDGLSFKIKRIFYKYFLNKFYIGLSICQNIVYKDYKILNIKLSRVYTFKSWQLAQNFYFKQINKELKNLKVGLR